jgi:hypothetical protein
VHTLARGPSGVLDQLVMTVADASYANAPSTWERMEEAVARLPAGSIARLELVLPQALASRGDALAEQARRRVADASIRSF